tara:strand:- start:176 stop:1243 length:1068 start_codon:yes stop_codon:yes gene_type:complete
MSRFKFPKISQTTNNKYYVSFYSNNKRHRLYNGKRIGSETNPNSYPIENRNEIAKILAYEIYQYINNGNRIKKLNSKQSDIDVFNSDKSIIDKALEIKLSESISNGYRIELKFAHKLLIKELEDSPLDTKIINLTLKHYKDNSSFNTLRKNLNVILEKAVELGLKENPIKKIKRRRVNAKLNKPFLCVRPILSELNAFDKNLYLCCLFTYGCLLRPHREVRELTWGDFSENLAFIKLAGSRNKSGRNRIVPVPQYIRVLLNRDRSNINIFTGNIKAFNRDYFKTLWGRFKKQSKILEEDQTLYSFRHSGAIDIFNRTGSITKLQKAMGHSSINVSLTYLRGLEVAELTEEDMPMV